MITFLLFIAVLVLICTNLAVGVLAIWLYKDHECGKTVTDFLNSGNTDGAYKYLERKEKEIERFPVLNGLFYGNFYKLPYMILESRKGI